MKVIAPAMVAVTTGSGTLIVAAAGNSRQLGSPLEYPASLPHVLTAGALGLLALAAAAGAATRGESVPAVRNGGTLVVGLTAGEPDVLDPTLARTFSGREVFLTFCEKLYDLNARAQIVPQLAAALPQISSDKLTVTIR